MTNLERLKTIISSIAFENFTYTKESLDYQLTGDYFHLTWMDMVYLLVEVKEQFHIPIDENDLHNYKFNSINSILETIERKQLSSI